MHSWIHTKDIKIAEVFAGECAERLKELEKEILRLESCPEGNGLLGSIMKRVHGIKLGSSFIGLPAAVRLCREMELVLDAFKERKEPADTGVIDALLFSADFLSAYMSGVLESLKGSSTAVENGVVQMKLENGDEHELAVERLRQAREKSEAGNGEGCGLREEASPEEDADFEILKSDEFKRGLTQGIREQFLYESSEHIDRIENDFLIRLDADGGDMDTVNEIFRAIHSIKGGAGIYLSALPPQAPEYSELKKLSEVVHSFESLLALIRDKRCIFEKRHVDLSLSVMDYLKSFINAAALEEFGSICDNGIIEAIKRQMSDIKGSSGGPAQNAAAAGRQEPEKNADSRSKSVLAQSIRVSQEKLDKMMNMISELLVAKNSFMHISSKLSLEYDLPEISKEVKQVGAHINRISDGLQDAIMSIRMVEIKTVFQRMPRVVRDIAQSTGKKMELHMEGEDTEIDKTIIEQISDPLVHLIRNAADHGIESPDERLSTGKPETGRIVLRAYNRNKHVFVEIEDDGKGIDAAAIKEKAVEKGFISAEDAGKMSRSQLLGLIFLPGFSTAGRVTEVSGRGVGMDIVKSNIAKINGNVMIESEAGKGTKIAIRLPLSLAVSRGLVVESAGETYIIPLEHIAETVKINRSSIHQFHGKRFASLRGDVIGVDWLCRIFAAQETDAGQEELNAVILSNGADNYAIVVDRLKNEQEFVIKPLEGHLAAVPGISGSTLLGNGQVVLILNPVEVIQLAENNNITG
ncbi:MAG: chemotaxis protein CheA [Bacillota bacterium]